ncbi:MAG TPA: hypothetical protein VH280_05020 [Verrucomicrobiae bacterium]|jgi:hypothetical protein|nr:hypothetical protein [Verrucomicrobiae bacterium]
MSAGDWAKIIAGAIAAIVAAGVVIKFVLKSKQKNVTHVTQKNNKIGGDNAGRDINK